ncbi:hypothetical protein ACTFIR_006682 [Dictyostelium discoideum]
MSTLGDKESIIFKEKSFGGEKWSLQNGSRYGNHAGALRSLKVGKFCKNWYDIVQAIDVEFKYSVDIRFNHNVKGRDPKAFQLTVIPYQLKGAEIVSGGDYSGVQIPELNPPDSEIVCQISIRELAWPGQIFANGSIYFKYTPSNNTVSYRKTEGWPTNCEIVQDDVSGFTITLNSI